MDRKLLLATMENCTECNKPIPKKYMKRHLYDVHAIGEDPRLNQPKIYYEKPRDFPLPKIKDGVDFKKILEFDYIVNKSFKEGRLWMPILVKFEIVKNHIIIGDKIRVTLSRVKE